MDQELPVADQPDYKKFILFAFEPHGPSGGLDDVDSSHGTLDEALVRVEDYFSQRCNEDHVGYVVDRDTWKVVAHTNSWREARYVDVGRGRKTWVVLNETPVTG